MVWLNRFHVQLQKSTLPGYSSCVGGRTEIKRIVAADDMGKSMVGQTARWLGETKGTHPIYPIHPTHVANEAPEVSVCGWVKTAREALNFSVVASNSLAFGLSWCEMLPLGAGRQRQDLLHPTEWWFNTLGHPGTGRVAVDFGLCDISATKRLAGGDWFHCQRIWQWGT